MLVGMQPPQFAAAALLLGVSVEEMMRSCAADSVLRSPRRAESRLVTGAGIKVGICRPVDGIGEGIDFGGNRAQGRAGGAMQTADCRQVLRMEAEISRGPQVSCLSTGINPTDDLGGERGVRVVAHAADDRP